MKVETQDFYLSVFLCLNGLDLLELKDYDQRKLFVFEDTDKFQQLKRQYYFNQAKVDPLLFKKQIRELKALIATNNQ